MNLFFLFCIPVFIVQCVSKPAGMSTPVHSSFFESLLPYQPSRSPANFTLNLSGGDTTNNEAPEESAPPPAALTELDGTWRYDRMECLEGSRPVPSQNGVMGAEEFYQDPSSWGQFDIYRDQMTLTEKEGSCTRSTSGPIILNGDSFSFDVPTDWHQNCTGVPSRDMRRRPMTLDFRVATLSSGETFLVLDLPGAPDRCTNNKPARLFLRRPQIL